MYKNRNIQEYVNSNARQLVKNHFAPNIVIAKHNVKFTVFEE